VTTAGTPWTLRGHKKWDLIRELAAGDRSQSQLAEKYGVTSNRISSFNRQYADEIQAVRNDLENKFAGLWIAQKEKRLQEYQEDVDRLNVTLEVELDAVALRIKHNALLRAAEEMGQLPTKQTLQVEQRTVHYQIEGVNPEDLT
jgi:hypothetical protein